MVWLKGAERLDLCTTAFLGIVSLNSAVPGTSEERASFYRERAAETFNLFWYFLGFTLTDIPYVLVASLLFAVVCLPLPGFTDIGDLGLNWLNLTLPVLALHGAALRELPQRRVRSGGSVRSNRGVVGHDTVFEGLPHP